MGFSSVRRPGALAAGAICLSFALTGITPVVASAADTGGSGESAPATPSSYRVPTQAEIDAKRAEAAALTAQLGDAQRALDAATAELARLQTELDAAVAEEQAAKARETAALADADAQQARLDAATAVVEQGKQSAGQLASKAYRGDRTRDANGMLGLFVDPSGTKDVGERLHMVELVGQLNSSTLSQNQTARAVQADATTRAAAAQDAASAAHADAVAAQTRAEEAVTKQGEQMVIVATLRNQLQGQATTATNDGNRMAAEKAKADAEAAARAAAAAGGGNGIVGAVGNCKGGSLAGYGNGQVPTSVLCPLYGAPGHMLRADAAKAFNDMSVAYAGEFGAPICVTDSYRSISEQRRLKREKPRLAATPGRSNHGYGKALDLCGGIQSFDTAQHRWMQANAPTFGYCDPYWSRANGSKPEPWHWQYLDCSS